MDLSEYQTNMVPFPRLHFMTTSVAPMISTAGVRHENYTCQRVAEAALDSSNFFVQYSSDSVTFDPKKDLYMAICLMFRGDVVAKEANRTLNWLKTSEKVQFVDWCPTGFKTGLCDEPLACVEDD